MRLNHQTASYGLRYHSCRPYLRSISVTDWEAQTTGLRVNRSAWRGSLSSMMESTTSRPTKLLKLKSKETPENWKVRRMHNLATVRQFRLYLSSLRSRQCCTRRTVQLPENSRIQLTFAASTCQCGHHRLR